MMEASVLGAGLAGCEAAWQLAERGVKVELWEMKPQRHSPAHISNNYGELVCSNSLRSDELTNAVGLLKEEMRRLHSLIMAAADATRLPAGGALAVDRESFSAYITQKIRSHPNIHIREEEAIHLPKGTVVVATGPLTSDALADKIARLTGNEGLSFFDAAAPIVAFDSVNMEKAFFASRYDKGTADYINCPMTGEEYTAFQRELAAAEEAEVHGFEDKAVFEGCLPVEVMARRGVDTLRFGPLKPRGIIDPKTGREPYAVVQLRRDNKEGSLYNLVGFQTHLRIREQKRVFSMIPGLEEARFLRYGKMHRNTYLNSPRLLDRYYRLLSDPRIRFAGQMTGVEGYVESAASGLLVGIETARELAGKAPVDFPSSTAIGAMAAYISGGAVGDFQPMNVNFGIIDPLETRVRGKRNKNAAISRRSLDWLECRIAQEEGEKL